MVAKIELYTFRRSYYAYNTTHRFVKHARYYMSACHLDDDTLATYYLYGDYAIDFKNTFIVAANIIIRDIENK